MRVLVVEGEPAISGAVAAVLRRRGDAVDIAGDGHVAIDWASAYDYDVIVLDVNLPGVDGFGVCRTLRSDGVRAAILMRAPSGRRQDGRRPRPPR